MITNNYKTILFIRNIEIKSFEKFLELWLKKYLLLQNCLINNLVLYYYLR